LPAGTEENTKTSVMIAVSGPRFEPGTSWIRSRSVNYWTTSFGEEHGGKRMSTKYCRQETTRRHRRRWENIKINIRGVGWEGLDWIHLAQYRDQRRALANTVLTFGFYNRRVANFLISWGTIELEDSYSTDRVSNLQTHT
jgi:hypothetical protein